MFEIKLPEPYKTNWDDLDKEDAKAKKKGVLKGRYITEPYADGQAVYKIVKVNKKTVKIEVVVGIGDDWAIPYWGAETSIERDYAEKKIAQRDAMTKIFGGK
jgi:hypothetical protein